MPKIKANGAEFYYELHGKGQPIILISGYNSDHLAWSPILSELSQYAQVLIFDNRGMGQTIDDGRALSVELMAHDVMALSKELGLKKPHIVGSSMGGAIAQAVASLYPEEIGKLCVMVSSAKWREAPLLAFDTLLKMREANIAFDFIFDSLIAWLFGQKFLQEKEGIALLKKMILEDPYPQSLIDQKRQFEALKNFDGRSKLKNIKAPTLIINGQEDLISLPEDSEYLVKHIRNATLKTLDCAHMVVLEAGQQFVRLVVEFFIRHGINSVKDDKNV